MRQILGWVLGSALCLPCHAFANWKMFPPCYRTMAARGKSLMRKPGREKRSTNLEVFHRSEMKWSGSTPLGFWPLVLGGWTLLRFESATGPPQTVEGFTLQESEKGLTLVDSYGKIIRLSTNEGKFSQLWVKYSPQDWDPIQSVQDLLDHVGSLSHPFLVAAFGKKDPKLIEGRVRLRILSPGRTLIEIQGTFGETHYLDTNFIDANDRLEGLIVSSEGNPLAEIGLRVAPFATRP
jgi:hypothetical protein